MEGDFFINSIITASADIVAYGVSGFILDRIGLRFSYLASFAVALAGGALYIAFRSINPGLTPIFLLLSNYGNSWGTNIDWNANAMLFPVIYASSTNGVCNLFAMLSTVIAPQIAEFPQPWPIVVAMIMSGVGAVMASFLKEKRKKKEQTITAAIQDRSILATDRSILVTERKDFE